MEDYGSSGDNYCSYEDDDDDELDSIELKHPDVETGFPSSSKVITKASLLAAQKEDLQRVTDLLSLKEHHARTLLIHYRWDVDKIFTVFVEKGKDKLYGEACITVEDHHDHKLRFLPSSKAIFCEICMEEVPLSETTQMECGHYFCNCCWVEHFIVKINEGQSRQIRCMAYKCDAICEEGKIISLVKARDPNLAERFNRILLESYIEDNKRVKWCPSVPHCGNAIRVENDEYCEVECSCGQQFCFSCTCEAHSPCSCQIWELWSKKCKDESETVNWITVNTMNCPKCGKAVEKNGGCNLVSCICGQAFCWLCGQPNGYINNSTHGHNCGRYTVEHEINTKQAKLELKRYVHYHNRFKAHTDSFKAEVKLKRKMKAKISNLEARKMGCRDFSWVWSGIYRLFRSRRILSYSYPFAYYMFGGEIFRDEMTDDELLIKKNLFEDQQQQLEANVERLSMFLEEPFDGFDNDNVMRTRMNVINLTKLTDDLCKKLYECIDNDLLGPLKREIHIIAPYRSKGAEKAEDLCEKDSTNNGMFRFERYSISEGCSKRYKKSEVSSRG